MMLHQNFKQINMKNFFVAENFPKKQIGNPARIPPQTPPAGGNSAEAKRKINIPRKTDFRFAESVLKPHALPEYLEGRTPKEKHPFLFQEKIHPRQIRNARSVFSFGVAGVLASAWGFLRTYDLVSLHHARRACDIICFGNECELGTIDTPIRNSKVFSEDTNGRRKAPTKDFLAGLQENSEFLARWRALFFRQEAGAKSEAILTHSICLIQKEFLLL